MLNSISIYLFKMNPSINHKQILIGPRIRDGTRSENLRGQVVMQRHYYPAAPSILPKSKWAYAHPAHLLPPPLGINSLVTLINLIHPSTPRKVEISYQQLKVIPIGPLNKSLDETYETQIILHQN